MSLYSELLGVPDLDKPAIEGSSSLSYRALIHQVNGMADHLAQHGVRAGSRIAVLSDNHVGLVALYFAASRLGAALVFLYDLGQTRQSEWRGVLADAQPGFFVHDAAHGEVAKHFAAEGPRCFSIEHLAQLSVACAPAQVDAPSEDDTFLQTYTSGTTGVPKGVCISARSLRAEASEVIAQMGIQSESRVLLTGFLFNTTGIPVSLGTMLTGATLVLRRFTDPVEAFAQVESDRISHFMLQPAGIARALHDPQLRERDLSCIHTIAYGAAPMPRATLKKARAVLPCRFLQGYGLTETCGPVTWWTDEDDRAGRAVGSVGRVTARSELVIQRADGQPAEVGEVGEICVRGGSVMLGYWDAQKKAPDVLPEGWFATGDLGYLDAEGFLFLKGRKKDVVVRAGGFTVYAMEVENVAALAGVECAVVGFDQGEGEDGELSETGEVPVAILGGTPCETDLRRLQTVLDEHLHPLKHPDVVLSWGRPLPRNRNGKLRKNELRAGLSALMANHVAPGPATASGRALGQA